MAQLGKFHGTFYALKQTDRTAFDQLKNQLQEARYGQVPQEQWAQRLRFGPKRAATTVRNNPETSAHIPEEYLQKMDTRLDNTFKYLKEKVFPKEPLAIVGHGDYLRNNLAFRYAKDSVGF